MKAILMSMMMFIQKMNFHTQRWRMLNLMEWVWNFGLGINSILRKIKQQKLMAVLKN